MTKAIPIVHFDIAGPDLEALHRFYGGLTGWAITPRGPGYSQIATADGSPDGAMTEAEVGGLSLGLLVDDLDATLARIGALGGEVALPAVDNGWVRKAAVRDPAGNLITLIQA